MKKQYEKPIVEKVDLHVENLASHLTGSQGWEEGGDDFGN